MSRSRTSALLVAALIASTPAAAFANDGGAQAESRFGVPGFVSDLLNNIGLGGEDAETEAVADDVRVAADIEPHIIGGKEVNELMGAATLIRGNGGLLCSGSQIAPEWFLTAKHCTEIFKGDSSSFKVRLGSLDKSNGGVVAGIAEYHEVRQGDVALIKLDREVTEYPMVKLADKLPSTNSSVNVYGWGKTALGGQPSERLKTADTRYTRKGRDLRQGPALTLVENDGMANRGDSGGPAMHDGLQVGVCSGGNDRGTGYYASVPDHRDWIKKISGV